LQAFIVSLPLWDKPGIARLNPGGILINEYRVKIEAKDWKSTTSKPKNSELIDEYRTILSGISRHFIQF
jgi:hypothetical protein